MPKTYTVEAFWDDEAKVWCAEGVDVPGLCTEAATMEKLVKKLEIMVPEMLEANGLIRSGEQDILFDLNSRISAVAHLHG